MTVQIWLSWLLPCPQPVQQPRLTLPWPAWLFSERDGDQDESTGEPCSDRDQLTGDIGGDWDMSTGDGGGDCDRSTGDRDGDRDGSSGGGGILDGWAIHPFRWFHNNFFGCVHSWAPWPHSVTFPLPLKSPRNDLWSSPPTSTLPTMQTLQHVDSQNTTGLPRYTQ